MQTHIILMQYNEIKKEVEWVRKRLREREREWIEIKSSCEGLTCYSVCEWRVRWSMQSFIVLNQYTLYMDSQSIPQYFYNFLFLHKIKRRHALYTEYCMRQNFRNKNLLSIVYGYCSMQMVIDDPPFAIIWYMVHN